MFKCYNSVQTEIGGDDDLINHKFLSFKRLEQSFLQKNIEINPVLTTDSIPMLLNMVLNNDGIAILPKFFCQEYLEDKKLVHILPAWKSKTEHLHILYPPSKNISHKVKVFVETAVSLFKD